MNAPVPADVVNALLTPLCEVLRTLTGSEPRIERLDLVGNLPEGPCLVVGLDFRGTLLGPVFWTFSPEVASKVAEAMTSTELPLAFDSPVCTDALMELSNMVAGNAVGALAEAGFPVEISVPRSKVSYAPPSEPLPEPQLCVSFQTPSGRMNVTFGLRLGARPAADGDRPRAHHA